MPPQLNYHKVLCEVLNDAEEEEADFDDKQEEENDRNGKAGNGSFSTLRDALDWSLQVNLAKKRLNNRWADKVGA